jgi:hypothetical protein
MAHMVGSNRAFDAPLLEERDPACFVSLSRTKDGCYLLLNSNSKLSSEVSPKLLGPLFFRTNIGSGWYNPCPYVHSEDIPAVEERILPVVFVTHGMLWPVVVAST